MLRLVLPAWVLMLVVSLAAVAEELPKVLILGDSISMGYTPVVTEFLREKAVVRRPAANCQSTDYGLENLKAWLGDEKWDLIHFNWGIWDTHYLYSNGQIAPADVEITASSDVQLRNSPAQYRANLEQLVAILKDTGAVLMWANTTPCMEEGSLRFQNIVKYNEVASMLMDKFEIPTTDLYSLAMPNRNLWQLDDTCHFNREGNQRLGEKVGISILGALESRENRATPE